MIGKRFLPQSLFGRALLILLLPTALIQLVMAYVFFDRHWDNVTRHMSNALAGEIAFFVHQLRTHELWQREQLVDDFEVTTGIAVSFDSRVAFRSSAGSDQFPEFQQLLHMKIAEPFTVRRNRDEGAIDVDIQLDDELLHLRTTVKRLESPTTILFLGWMCGATALFLFIAIMFLRNQIRPIRKLAEVADNFGRGIETPNFRPSGANEVRRAARAFIIMQERIKRQLRTRTEMLAGISHDLRTPLTRMKLELAMLPAGEAVQELNGDVQQMEHMIQEYLDFARGEGREEATRLALAEMLSDVVGDYLRLNAPVRYLGTGDVTLDIRASGFRRMLHNLIDNALRYGKTCDVSLRVATKYCEVMIDDEGPGIPEEKRDEVFKPFNRLDPSRNIKTGGVGLGLTIARDIALAHGGGITLENSPKGGLRVIIRLPL